MIRKIIMLILLLLTFNCPAANAYEFDKWDKADIALGAASLVLIGMDWRQTKAIVDNPDKWKETNQILGSHPSHGTVDAYFAASAVVVLGIAHILPSNYRKAWLAGMGIGRAMIVINNNSVGISIRW